VSADDEKAGNGYGHATQVDCERAADRPQNHNECRRRENRRYHSSDEIDW
jgi:hypothetical protein